MDDTADRILKFADRELGSVPEAEQETILREVLNELTTWMQAIQAGKDWERQTGAGCRHGSPSCGL